MLADLRKHAAASAGLRKAAGLLGAMGRGAAKVGKFAIKHPVGTALTVAGGIGAVGAYKQSQPAFNPEIQRRQLGIE